MARLPLKDEIAAVRALCRTIGVGEVAPVLLKAAHHTTLYLPSQAMVARVQSIAAPRVAQPRAVRELDVARYLAGRNAPVVAPLAGELAGPHLVGASVVTLWPYVEGARTAEDADAMLAAVTLNAVHRALRDYDGDLPPWTAALDRCWSALTDRASPLAPADRELLMLHLKRLRRQVEASDSPSVPLHGDAHPGNLLLGPRGPVWIDFEEACRGPRELDVACLPQAVWTDFGAIDQALVQSCADLKSVCVAVWCSADIARSAAVREAAEYHLQRVRGFPV